MSGLGEAADAGAPTRLDMVVFTAAGWRVGIEARHVASLTQSPGALACPPLEDLLGLPVAPPPGNDRYRLSLKGKTGDFLVAAPVEFVSLSPKALRPPPSLLALRTCLRGLRALIVPGKGDQENPMLLFDITGLCYDAPAASPPLREA